MAETAERKRVKPGIATTEFYVSVGAMVAPHLVEALPPTWRAILTTAAGVVYTVARLLQKWGVR